MKTYQLITKIKRIDDGQIFSIDDKDGKYYLDWTKKEFPNSLHFGYSLGRLLIDDHDSFVISEVKTITIEDK